MSRFDGGYIKLYRSLIASDLMQKGATHVGVWVTILLHASRFEISVAQGKERRKYPPGSIVLGQHRYASELNISPQTLRTVLGYLIRTERIVRSSTKRGTVLTVCNWSKYQHDQTQANTPPTDEQQTLNDPLTSTQQLNGDSKKQRIETRKSRAIADRDAPAPLDQVFAQKADQKSSDLERKKEPAKSDAVWQAYRSAYLARHGIEPIRNKKANALACQLVDRLGAVDAPRVASYYVSHKKTFYAERAHQLDYCVKDAEALLLEMKQVESGVSPTSTPRDASQAIRRVRTAFERTADNTDLDKMQLQALDRLGAPEASK